MISIRKFVGYTGAAAGIGAALALAISLQTALAAAPSGGAGDQPVAGQLTPECTAAIQAIKSAVLTDMSEDRVERAQAKMDPDLAASPEDDAAELANFESVVAAARTACAPAISSTTAPTKTTTFAASSQCTAALQAAKAIWAQGGPTSAAKWQKMQAAAQAVRAACAFT